MATTGTSTVNSTEIRTHFDNMLLDLRGKLTGNKYSKEIMDHLELIKLTNEKSETSVRYR